MKSFATTDGTQWHITVTVATIKRVMEHTGLKLTDLFSTADKIQQFFSDEVRFCEVLFAAVKPQADAAGKTIDDFLSVVDGAVIESAAEALLAETVDFFHEPRRGLLKKVLAKYLETTTRAKTEGALAMEQKLEELDFDRLFHRTLTSSVLSSQGPVA